MAGEFKLSFLWLVIACVVLASSSMEAPDSLSSTTHDLTSSPVMVSSSTNPVSPSTVTSGSVSSTTKTPSTVTTGSVSSTTKTPSLVTSGSVGSTTKTPSLVTSGSVGSTTKTPSTVATGSVGSTTKTPSTVTPGSVGSTTKTPSTVATGSVGSTTKTPSTVTPGSVGSTTKTPSTVTPGSVGSTTNLAPSATMTPGSVGSSATPVPSSTTAPGPCDINPCGQGSTCEVRAKGTFVCLCLPGENYNYIRQSCENAKVFPGQLALPKLTYDPNMKIKGSPEFNEASQIIYNELATVFTAPNGYSNVTVLTLEPLVQSKVRSKSQQGINASIEILFTTNSTITTDEINSKMVNASKCEGCQLAGASFSDTELCDKNPCHKLTTECQSGDGTFKCTCKSNYIKTDFSDRICIACDSGLQAENSLICVPCAFGYSGLNCSESWKLTLVIVGSVLGGLLLITLIILPIVAVKCSKKKTKKNSKEDIGKPYVSHSPVKLPLVNGNSSLANSQAPSLNGSAYGNAGVPKIPRATTTTSSWDSRTNLEMVPSNSRQNLISVDRNSRLYDDPDDMVPYTQSRPQGNEYAQVRPRNNPYAQDRPQISPYAQDRPQISPYAQDRPQISPYAQDRAQNNPYAQNQGHANPYYVHNNEKWSN
ncbi:mucin-13b [Scophthalmus maximus]|uniref:Mucin-13-like n=1 Tax=Scophthalmus maximus TaxID=52904 RepID=A0A8D3B941_SCOMX|nr:mucin-13b [Scophthalmus maximus]